MAQASFTRVGSLADSPETPLGPSPAAGHAAEILDVYNPYLGYDATKFAYKPPPWGIRPTFRTGLLGGLCGNIFHIFNSSVLVVGFTHRKLVFSRKACA
jgi:hypothetical protein